MQRAKAVLRYGGAEGVGHRASLRSSAPRRQAADGRRAPVSIAKPPSTSNIARRRPSSPASRSRRGSGSPTSAPVAATSRRGSPPPSARAATSPPPTWMGPRSRPSRGRAPSRRASSAPRIPGSKPASTDRILVSEVDHYLGDRADYLRRLARALKPGGFIAVTNRLPYRDPLVAAVAAAGLRASNLEPAPPVHFYVKVQP